MENDKALEFEKEINRYIAAREPLDLTAVYEHLKDKYPLILTNTFPCQTARKTTKKIL